MLEQWAEAHAATHRELETCSRRLEELAKRLAALERRELGEVNELSQRLDRLTMAVAEGIEHVDRAERRVRATVARARKQLEEHGLESPGLEAEWAELRERDGDGGEERGVPPMREEVEEDPSRPISLGDAFPGSWTEGDLPSLME